MGSRREVIDLTASDNEDDGLLGSESQYNIVNPARAIHRYAPDSRPNQPMRHGMSSASQSAERVSSQDRHDSTRVTVYSLSGLQTQPIGRSRYSLGSRNRPMYLPANSTNTENPFASRSLHQPPPYSTAKSPPVFTEAKKLVRRCEACAQDRVQSCDGEQPCSSCAEPGIPCVYAGESIEARKLLNVSVRPAKLFLGTGYERAMPPRHYTDQTVAPTNTIKLKLKRISTPLLSEYSAPPPDRLISVPVSGLAEDTFYDDGSDSEHSIPLALDTIEQIKALLEKAQARLRLYREYLLKPQLIRARNDAATSPGPNRIETDTNTTPFTQLIAASKASLIDRPKAQSITLQIRSHKPGALKKWNEVKAPLTIIKTNVPILPKYKSIGRLGANLLAPNSGVLKYLPYFADVEQFPDADQNRIHEIEDYYRTDEHRMRNQRTCLELADFWKATVEQFMSDLEIQFKDVLWHMLQKIDNDKDRLRCDKCKTSLRSMVDTEALNRNAPPMPDPRTLNRAELAVRVFHATAQFSIWHIVVEAQYVKEILSVLSIADKETTTLCSICFVYNCMLHGTYDEPEDESSGALVFGDGNSQGQSGIQINDDEHNLNQRRMAVVPFRPREDMHQCGLYCVEPQTAIRAILGRKLGGGAEGVYNRAANATVEAFENSAVCSPDCFWQKDKRTQFSKVEQLRIFQIGLKQDDVNAARSLLRLYSDNQRVPCIIAAEIESLSCMDAFFFILAEMQNPSHIAQRGLEQQQQAARKPPKTVQGIDVSESGNLDERPPFIPCSHEGSCHGNPDCTCSEDHVHCERFCGCDLSCKRRYRGCSCAGSNRTCFDDSRCECWSLNRECDPWLCGTCGAVEVLDPANKYREEIHKGRCRNTKIQLELPARTIKAPSEVQGWGLFAGQDLEKFAFIGEYKGELVGNQESDRRGSVYHHLGQEYLFTVNREQQIDGSSFGNKMRFVNNSQRPDFINVLAKNLLCNGVQRVMLYSKRAVKAGDELLYNYNYPDSVTKTFWERGEAPSQGPGALVAKPAISMVNGRLAKKTTDDNSERLTVSRTSSKLSGPRRETTQERLPNGRFVTMDKDGAESNGSRDVKRKRASDSEVPPTDPAAEEGSEFEDGGGSDSGHVSDAAEDAISSAEDNSPAAIRQRRIYPTDRRFGGQSQRKAWDTRKSYSGQE